MQQEINQRWRFNQSPQEVWEYLTKSDLLEQWLAKTDFQPVVGHKFQFEGKQGSLIFCEVREVEPYARLAYWWQTNSAKDGKPFNSKVVWILVPKDNGTELQLVHSAFTYLEDYTKHNNGWTVLGNRLKQLLSTIKI
ncbi:MAG: hypothetical protein C5B59_18620 [Bacteroidetes bacterium]|nr:MAG: hypothetical protein C5B59_18620 [Bacteroidota bacterium]